MKLCRLALSGVMVAAFIGVPSTSGSGETEQAHKFEMCFKVKKSGCDISIRGDQGSLMSTVKDGVFTCYRSDKTIGFVAYLKSCENKMKKAPIGGMAIVKLPNGEMGKQYWQTDDIRSTCIEIEGKEFRGWEAATLDEGAKLRASGGCY